IALQRRMEHYALRRASAVLATSPRSAAELTALCRQARASAHVSHIFNGFDPDDLQAAPPDPPPQPNRRWRLVYTRPLSTLMSPEPPVQAIERLAVSRPDLAARIDLVFAGRLGATQTLCLVRLGGICRLETHDYVSHADAIALMQSADALCLLLSDLP